MRFQQPTKSNRCHVDWRAEARTEVHASGPVSRMSRCQSEDRYAVRTLIFIARNCVRKMQTNASWLQRQTSCSVRRSIQLTIAEFGSHETHALMTRTLFGRGVVPPHDRFWSPRTDHEWFNSIHALHSCLVSKSAASNLDRTRLLICGQWTGHSIRSKLRCEKAASHLHARLLSQRSTP